MIALAAMTTLMLLARAPAPSSLSPRSVAVFPLQAGTGVPRATADLLTEFLVEEVRLTRVFERVVGPAEIAALTGPTQAEQILACASDDCAVLDLDIGGALGTSHVLVGTVGKLDDSFLYTLRLVELRTGLVQASLVDRARLTSDGAMVDVLRPAVRRLLVPTQPAKPSAPGVLPVVLRGVALGAGAAAGVAVIVAVVSLVGFLGLRAFDESGMRSGDGHRIPRTLAFGANGIFIAALLSPIVWVPLTAVGAGLLGVSWGVH